MPNEDAHLSDEEMFLVTDGELPSRCAALVHAHLAACWGCRARMAEMEETIAAFARAYRQTLDPRLPSISGPRALLRARLAELASKPEANSWRRLLNFTLATRDARIIGAAVLIAALAGSFLVHRSTPHRASNSALAAQERGVLPDRSLTPGATRRVITISDVCSMAREEVVSEVSTSLRQEVLKRYGIVNAQASDYEIDYLIAPGLGGVESIENLWPAPYASRTWNAHVKDDLEERLHEMVCDRELDLSAAQRDIATDWIAAYKKYFHTDRPLALHSQLGSLNESVVCEPELGGTPSQACSPNRSVGVRPSEKQYTHKRHIFSFSESNLTTRVHTDSKVAVRADSFDSAEFTVGNVWPWP
jgi:predicted anti-sigma-YlaC factor YlaD